MRSIVIKLALFFGLLEALGRINLLVLLSAMAVGLAVIVCTDLILAQ